jgi:hypothetical protein
VALERFNKEQAGFIYDALFKAVCVEPPLPMSSLTTKDAVEEHPEMRIGPRTFKVYLNEIATWPWDENIVMNGFQVG